MPSVKEWATSLSKTNSRAANSRRTSSVADDHLRSISANSLSNLDVNDSERTLISTLGVDSTPGCSSGQSRRKSSASSSSPEGPYGLSFEKASKDSGSIECRVDYFVVEDDRYAIQFGNYTGVWAGDDVGSVPQTRSRYFGDHIHQNAYKMTNKA